MRAPTATLGRLRAEARSMTAREGLRAIVAAYERNSLLTYAHAIAFQVLFALVPLALFAVGLVGFLGLDELWTREVVPKLQESTSSAAFTLINETAHRVLGQQQLFWVTIGAVITVWEMSGATRTVMEAYDRIYECEERRSTRRRYVVSVWLATATGTLLLAAFALFTFGPALWDPIAILRWPVVAAMLFATIALFVHFAPSDGQPLDWVTFGAVLVVGSWLGTSVAFAFYVRNLADYGSIYGALATVIIVFTYLNLSTIAFLTGAQVDALVRRRLDRRESEDGGAAAPAPSERVPA